MSSGLLWVSANDNMAKNSFALVNNRFIRYASHMGQRLLDRYVELLNLFAGYRAGAVENPDKVKRAACQLTAR
jgi:hypothetical protein